MDDASSLSDKIIEDNEYYKHGWIQIEDVKESVQKLKENCFICGKNLKSIRNSPRFNCSIPLCSQCREDMSSKSFGRIQRKLSKKIDKIFGSALIK